jgi:hypothetical protein
MIVWSHLICDFQDTNSLEFKKIPKCDDDLEMMTKIIGGKI